jgi:hypothetical protein
VIVGEYDVVRTTPAELDALATPTMRRVQAWANENVFPGSAAAVRAAILAVPGVRDAKVEAAGDSAVMILVDASFTDNFLDSSDAVARAIADAVPVGAQTVWWPEAFADAQIDVRGDHWSRTVRWSYASDPR